MKTIKLTILGLLISINSFSQLIWNFGMPNPDNITDSIRYVISEDRIYEFNEESEILNKYSKKIDKLYSRLDGHINKIDTVYARLESNFSGIEKLLSFFRLKK